MQERYIRNIPALSEEECALLKTKRVAVIGCGGLGGYLVELLARIGVGSLQCVDGDVFDESNLNRQLFSTTALLGTNKADAAAARVAVINPDVAVSVVKTFLDAENAERLIENCDVVLDALDNIIARKQLANACAKTDTPYIYGAINGWFAQAAISMPGDNLIERLYPEGTQLKDNSALSFTPALCASVQAALCIKLLVGRGVESGKIYYFDLLNHEYETISIL